MYWDVLIIYTCVIEWLLPSASLCVLMLLAMSSSDAAAAAAAVYPEWRKYDVAPVYYHLRHCFPSVHQAQIGTVSYWSTLRGLAVKVLEESGTREQIVQYNNTIFGNPLNFSAGDYLLNELWTPGSRLRPHYAAVSLFIWFDFWVRVWCCVVSQ